jgi:hypothetical protein
VAAARGYSGVCVAVEWRLPAHWVRTCNIGRIGLLIVLLFLSDQMTPHVASDGVGTELVLCRNCNEWCTPHALGRLVLVWSRDSEVHLNTDGATTLTARRTHSIDTIVRELGHPIFLETSFYPVYTIKGVVDTQIQHTSSHHGRHTHSSLCRVHNVHDIHHQEQRPINQVRVPNALSNHHQEQRPNRPAVHRSQTLRPPRKLNHSDFPLPTGHIHHRHRKSCSSSTKSPPSNSPQAIPAITTEFHSLTDIGWYVGAYTLAAATLQPISGKLYTYFPTKAVFLSFVFLFELGSLLCGVAQSSPMLIIGRAVAGIGVSGIFNGAITVITSAVGKEKVPLYFGVLLGISQMGIVAGPLVGGALTEHASWRWCEFCFDTRVFWILVC